MTNSIGMIRGNNGINLASSPAVTTLRTSGSTTILVNTVTGLPASFIAEMGTPDLVTGLISNGVVFKGHIVSNNIIIDEIGVGYTDNGSAVNDIIVLKPTAEWANNIADAIESLYPIGTIYTNKTDATNPATLFGFGTWTAITDKFIVAAGTTYAAGTAYGAATHIHPLSDAGAARMSYSATGTGPLAYQYVETDSYVKNISVTTGAIVTGSGSATRGISLGGATDAGSTIPPTVAAYVWERTA